MEGRRAHAVAHLAYARSQKSGTGILGSKRVLQGGEKSSPLVVLCDLWLVYGVYGLGGEKMWSGERNYGLGSSADGGKYGPGSQTATPGQAPPKYGPGSQTVPPGHPQPRYGPGRETAAPGQARPRPSVVQGAKLRVWVKHWWREVWSREPNCGLGSSPSPPKYGPGSQTAAQVTPCPAKVWSREQNRAPGSSQAPPECGLGSKTVPPGQARPRQSMV